MANSQQMFMRGGKWVSLKQIRELNKKEEVISKEVVPEPTQDDLSEEEVEVEQVIEENSLEAVTAKYEAKFDKKVPVNKKNKIEWIINKINE